MWFITLSHSLTTLLSHSYGAGFIIFDTLNFPIMAQRETWVEVMFQDTDLFPGWFWLQRPGCVSIATIWDLPQDRFNNPLICVLSVLRNEGRRRSSGPTCQRTINFPWWHKLKTKSCLQTDRSGIIMAATQNSGTNHNSNNRDKDESPAQTSHEAVISPQRLFVLFPFKHHKLSRVFLPDGCT